MATSLSAAQKKSIALHVAKNYAPKLRKGAVKKFTTRATKDLTSGKDPLAFITGAQARAKAKTTTTSAPAAPAGPYDRYKVLPGGVSGLEDIDRQSAAHQTYAKGITDSIAPFLQGLSAQNAQAQQTYAGLAGQYAQMGSMPVAGPLVSGGGGQVQPGASQVFLNQQQELGNGVAAAGTQDASYRGYMSQLANSNLSQGLIAGLGQNVQNIPGKYNAAKTEYMQKLDNMLFEMDQAAAEQEAEAAIEQQKMANDRYKAKLQLIGSLTGTNAKLALGQLDADTTVATNNADNATSRANNSANNATKRDLAAYDRQTKLMTQESKNRIEQLKIKAKASGSAADRSKLIAGIRKDFDALWTGEEGDITKGSKGYGWRFTTRANREKGARQVIAWLQGTGLGPKEVHKLFRSKGFTDAEFQRAVRSIQSGGGI